MSWTPPDDLVAFMDKARADGKPIVYIGFGSVTVPRPNKVTNAIIKAVLLSQYTHPHFCFDFSDLTIYLLIASHCR